VQFCTQIRLKCGILAPNFVFLEDDFLTGRKCSCHSAIGSKQKYLLIVTGGTMTVFLIALVLLDVKNTATTVFITAVYFRNTVIRE